MPLLLTTTGADAYPAHRLRGARVRRAFAAGIVMCLAHNSVDPDFRGVVPSKLEAFGFGFPVPIFFVVSGWVSI